MKKLIISVVIILLLSAGVKFSLDYYLSNRFVTDIEGYIGKSISTKVDIGSISTDIFSVLSLNDIKIYEPHSENLFLSANSLNCSYSFSEILKKNFVINDIICEKLNLNIQRYSNSKFNFQKFMNLVMDFNLFHGNLIYAAEKETVLPDYVKINDVNVKKASIKYTDPLLQDSLVSGDIDVNVMLDPLKADLRGKLFNNEDISLSVKMDKEIISGKINLKNLDAMKYEDFFRNYTDSYEIKINKAVFDISGDFSFNKELRHTSEIIVREFDADYSLIKIKMKDQKIFVKDKDIIMKENVISFSAGEKPLGNVVINGEFKDFREFRSKIKTEILRNSILSIFGFSGQDIFIEKSDLNGMFEIKDMNSPDPVMTADINIPAGEYFFLTTDGNKIVFPFSELKIDTVLSHGRIELSGKGKMLHGSLSVNTVFENLSDFSMKNTFVISGVSAEEFFKLNKLVKIPVYGDLSGNFSMTGKNFDISTFMGEGDIILSKGVFKTAFIDKLLVRSSSQTLRELPMKDIQSKVTLSGEKISFGKITGSGDDVNVNGDGYISLDTSMYFGLDMDVLKPFIEKNKLDKLLSTEDDFRLEISGTLFSPETKTNIDDILKAKLKRQIDEKKDEELDKLKDKAKDFFKKLLD